MTLVAPAGRPPPAAAAPPAPPVSARAYVVLDDQSGYVLASRNADARLAMASTTKIMTGLLVLERCKDLKQKVVADRDAVEVGESEIWLRPGEKLTVDQMLKALLIQSANDAAMALADHVAGSEKKFVALMNQRAAELGLTNTHFTNPHGLDERGHYTSAMDLARLTRLAMQDERFAGYVRQFTARIPWKGNPWPRVLETHNTLLQRFSWVDGVKTGWTDPAGYCVALSGEYGRRRFIVTLLGDPTALARERDGLDLFRYASGLYGTRRLGEAGAVVGHAAVPYYDEGVDLVTTAPVEATVRRDAETTATVEARGRLGLPLAQGMAVGRVVFSADGVVLGRQKIVTARGFAGADWRTRVGYQLHEVWGWLAGL